jgi:hypothetical protein
MDRMGMCAGCGGIMWIDQLDVTQFGDRSPRYMDGMAQCESCGGSVEARWALYSNPVLAGPLAAMVAVYAGPPAPWPHVPSHAEWLASWGIGPDVGVYDLP